MNAARPEVACNRRRELPGSRTRKGPNTKLKVTFFWPFTGNYWIIDLDPEYRWAVVGEPGRNYLWILSREPRMDEALYNHLVDKAAGI